MSKAGDPAKGKEAQEALKEGQKHMTTTMFKWKPDYLAAEPCFQKAARAFKQAGLMDSACDAWRKAADCAYRMGNLKQAAITLENAGREMSVSKDAAGKTEACRLWAESAGFLQEAGETVRSCDLRLRAAKAAEGFDNDLAIRLVDEVCNMFDGDEDKDVYAVDPLRKAMQMQLSLGKHASAMRTMDRLWKVWSRLDQKHNLYKLVLSRVILLLAAADPVAAQQEYDKNLDLGGFATTAEAEVAEDLLQAYTDMDAEAMKAVLTKSAFGFLENAITKLARGLPDALLTGGQVGVSKAEEAASKAVVARVVQPGQFRELGSGTASAIGGGSGEEETRDEVKNRKAAAKEADARSALFARPAAGAAAGAGASGAAAGVDESDAFADASLGDGAEYDYESAFKEMTTGDGIVGPDTGASNAAGGADVTDREDGQPPAAAAGDFSEDLGLM